MINTRMRPGIAADASILFLVAVAAFSCGSPQTSIPSPTAQPQSIATVSADPASVDPTAIPTQTQPAHVPPPPDSITPRPTDRSITPEPRPRFPTAADIKMDGSGKYYADVDGCRWNEYGRFINPQTGEGFVGMQTPCLPDEGLHYSPATGEVAPFIT
jgi:hypothetical protein